MQGSGHGFDLHAAVFRAQGDLIPLADHADLGEPNGLARFEFTLAAHPDEGGGVAEIVTADQGLILIGQGQHGFAQYVPLGHWGCDRDIGFLDADPHRQVEIPGRGALALEIDGGVAADLHPGGEGDGQAILAAVEGEPLIDGGGLHLGLGVEGDLQLVEYERLRLLLQILSDLGRHGVREAAKRQ
ncbi:hypothetical protein D3C84_560980 [compost metagenome]